MRLLTYGYLAMFLLAVLLYVLSLFGAFVDPFVDPGM
jgi:hypothetical protein